jgi:hypothetical protein
MPDEGEAAFKRGFQVSNCGVNRVICTVKNNCDLVDAKQRISVEDEREKDLPAGEVLLAEGCTVGIGRFELTTATPDTIGVLPRSDRLIAAVRARCVFPEVLETPLDE